MSKVLLGDCLEVLKGIPDSSIDSVVTDPPYGLGTREPTAGEIIAYLQGEDLNHGGDFMGKNWQIPSVGIWKEVLRVLKPGGHLLAFGGTRTYDLISLGIRAAGFEFRDTIASQFGVQVFQWLQGSGFPKSLSVEKALIKDGMAPEDASQYSGLGTALKPSWEPIIVARKPVSESTIAKQVLKTGTGAINIDACRVVTKDNTTRTATGLGSNFCHDNWEPPPLTVSGGAVGGRWPANLVLNHTPSCKVVGTKKVSAPVINRFDDGMKPFGEGAGHKFSSVQTGDAGGNEEISVYDCAEGCPVAALDEQAGIRKTSGGNLNRAGIGFQGGSEGNQDYIPPSEGGVSRFFNQFIETPKAPFFYSSKTSKAERDRGIPKGTNQHPTVKPQALMQWLVRLVTPKGGTVLDPYCGSGSTLVAAIHGGFDYIGIERDSDSHHTATLRVAHAEQELRDKPMDLFELMGEVEP